MCGRRSCGWRVAACLELQVHTRDVSAAAGVSSASFVDRLVLSKDSSLAPFEISLLCAFGRVDGELISALLVASWMNSTSHTLFFVLIFLSWIRWCLRAPRTTACSISKACVYVCMSVSRFRCRCPRRSWILPPTCASEKTSSSFARSTCPPQTPPK